MIHSLVDLKSGKLRGVKKLKLACGLQTFPEEILSLSDTLEVLDLSGNALTNLPDSIVQLKKLKILFVSNNHFTVFPKILSEFPVLNMIGFKANKITSVPENAFPPLLNWLILTDNKIEKLPKSIGNCVLLQKCALAGNRIADLPHEMANCVNLELLRISANRLQVIPDWLFSLPKLSWVAFGGNPAVQKLSGDIGCTAYSWEEFEIKEVLGEGASGVISKAHWKTKKEEVAIKVFKGAVTSDGLPEDEMAISIATGTHSSLISVLGKIKDHPENKQGLVMALISPDFVNLGNPPSFETCTRDVFNANSSFTSNELLKMAQRIASVCAQLHSKGINHGDLYAHNILVNRSADCLLGDFGAATYYGSHSVQAHTIERVEVRAFGCLVEDILHLVPEEDLSLALRKQWVGVIADCTKKEVANRPSFSELVELLSSSLFIH